MTFKIAISIPDLPYDVQQDLLRYEIDPDTVIMYAVLGISADALTISDYMEDICGALLEIHGSGTPTFVEATAASRRAVGAAMTALNHNPVSKVINKCYITNQVLMGSYLIVECLKVEEFLDAY